MKKFILLIVATVCATGVMAQGLAAMNVRDRLLKTTKMRPMPMAKPDLSKIDRSMVEIDETTLAPTKRLKASVATKVQRRLEEQKAKVDSFDCYFNQTSLCDGIPMWDNMYASRVYATADSVYVPTTISGGGFLPAKRVGKALGIDEEADSIVIKTGIKLAAYTDGQKTVNIILRCAGYDENYQVVVNDTEYISGYFYPDGTVALLDGVGAATEEGQLVEASLDFWTLSKEIVDKNMHAAAMQYTSLNPQVTGKQTFRSVVADLGVYLFVAQLDPSSAQMNAATWQMLQLSSIDNTSVTYVLPYLQMVAVYYPNNGNQQSTGDFYYITNVGMSQKKMSTSYCLFTKDAVREDGSYTISYVPMNPEDGSEEYYYDIIIAQESYNNVEGTMDLSVTVIPDSSAQVKETVNVTTSKAGYLTFFDSKNAYSIPEGLKAYVVSDIKEGKLVYTEIKDVIPAGLAVLLVSESKSEMDYTMSVTTDSVRYEGTNLLHGSDEPTTTASDADYRYYKLTYGTANTTYSKLFGWYWGAVDGGAFSIEGHKAWLAVPKVVASRFFVLGNDLTAISELQNESVGSTYVYDLQGRKVMNNVKKGIYIQNNKKIIIK